MGAHATADGARAEVAKEIGATPAQTALAWLLHPADGVIPIPGTSSIAHAEENQAAAALSLTLEQFARLSGATGDGAAAA